MTDDKEVFAEWMIKHGYATGHGDYMEDLLEELEWQIAMRSEHAIDVEREACAKVCEVGTGEPIQMKALEMLRQERERIAIAIRARGQK